MATEQEEMKNAGRSYVDRNFSMSTESPLRKTYESIFIAGWEECMKFYGISKVPDQYDDERYVDENPR